MVDFASKGVPTLKATTWLTTLARVSMFCVTLSNAINISFLAVAASYQTKASALFSQVADQLKSPFFLPTQASACFILEKCTTLDFFFSATDMVDHSLRFQGYASICEGFSLVTILISFVVAGIHCIRRFNQSNIDANSAVGRQNNSVRIRIFVTVSSVFVSFLMRSVYAVVLAISRNNNKLLSIFSPDQKCDNTCLPCQQLGVIVQSWIYYTPQFSESLLLASSPLTMLIAVWGMTSPHFVQKMKARFSERNMASLTERKSILTLFTPK